MAVYRFGRWRDALRPGIRRKGLGLVYELLRRRVRGHYRIELHHTAAIGRRVVLDDRGAIVIGNGAVLGDDCVVSPYVTMAKTRVGRPGRPRIGDRVVIGPGASFVGGITVGDDAVVGPNTVVITDVPPASALIAASGRAEELAESFGCMDGETPFGLVRLDNRALPDGVEVGLNVRVARAAPPILDGHVTLGDACLIAERVTIGWAPPRGSQSAGSHTALGNRVVVAAGAVICRGIMIGDDARIGPNCVVESDVPARTVVKGSAGRVLNVLRKSTDP